MRRREIIGLIGGALVWPLRARAQAGDRMRVIGWLSVLAENDPESQRRMEVFKQALAELGWVEGRSVRIEARWAVDEDRLQKQSVELAALAPDVILTSGTVAVRPLQQATRTIPIVFVQVVDPVGSGYVDSLAHPGGNTTGFTQFEYSLSGKWVELLKEVAPNVTRVAVIRDPTRGPGVAQFAAIQTVAQSLGIELTPINALDLGDMERRIANFARAANGGLVVTTGGTAIHVAECQVAAERLKVGLQSVEVRAAVRRAPTRSLPPPAKRALRAAKWLRRSSPRRP